MNIGHLAQSSHVWKEITVLSLCATPSAWHGNRLKISLVHSLTLSINFRCLWSALPPLLPLPICRWRVLAIFFFILLRVQLPHHIPVHPLPCSYSSTSSFPYRQGHSGPLKQDLFSINSRLFSVIFPVPSFQIASLILSSFMSSCVSWQLEYLSFPGQEGQLSASALCSYHSLWKDTFSLHLFLPGEIFVIKSYLFIGTSYQR